MTLKNHLENAAERLEEAGARIGLARERATSLESLAEWLAALTDYSQALADIHSFNNESVHEKIQELSRRTKAGGATGAPKRA